MSASDLPVSFFVLLGIAVAFALLRRFGPRLAAAWGTVRARDTRWGRWLLSGRAALAVLIIAAIGALTVWFADLAYSHDPPPSGRWIPEVPVRGRRLRSTFGERIEVMLSPSGVLEHFPALQALPICWKVASLRWS